MVHESRWLEALDGLIYVRRVLRDTYGLSSRSELKAHHFRNGGGPFLGRGEGIRERMAIFRTALELTRANLAVVDAQVFGVAVNKDAMRTRDPDSQAWAWRIAVQRIDRLCNEKQERAMIFPDEGSGRLIKRLLRRTRRHEVIPGFYGGQLAIPARRILEDPHMKQSHDSYFTQTADWLAFAIMRSKHVHPSRKVPNDLWDVLGDLRRREVNQLRDSRQITPGPPGLVRWP